MARCWRLRPSSKMKSLFFLLLCCYWPCLLLSSTEVDVQSVKECVGAAQKEHGAPGKRKKPFHLNYGHSGIEYFNVLDDVDIARIEGLAECIRVMYAELTVDQGGARATHLTGLLQEVLPEQTGKLRRNVHHALRESDWQDRGSYGIRFAYHLEQRGDALSEALAHREGEGGEGSDFFVIAPRREREAMDRQRQEQRRARKQAEEETLRSYLLPSAEGELAGAYLSLLSFTARTHYTGGQVVVSHPPYESEGDDSEEEEEEEEEKVLRRRAVQLDTLPIERGSLLVSPLSPPGLAPRQVGLEKVFFGERRALVVEFWRYMDVPLSLIGTEKVGKEEGERLGLASQTPRQNEL